MVRNPHELQAALQGLISDCQCQAPSREKLAANLRGLADRVAGSIRWIERDDAKGHRWVADVQDANGDTWAWQIVEFQGPGIPLYRVQVLDPDGRMLKWKKQPKTLQEAQKFAEAWARSASSGASLLMQNDFVRIAATEPAEGPGGTVKVFLPTKGEADFDSSEKSILVSAIVRALAFYKPRLKGRFLKVVDQLFLDDA